MADINKVSKRKKEKAEDDLKGYVPRMYKQGIVFMIVSGAIICLIGGYLWITNTTEATLVHARGGGDSTGFVNGPSAITIGIIMIVLPLGMNLYSKRNKK